MHYYTFNIGDYARRTKYLDLMEDLAYRRLLDLYYLNEQPFAQDCTVLARKIGMKEHTEAVQFVLDEFFPNGINRHADAEITRVREKSEKARQSALKRHKGANAQRTQSEGNATQYPIPNTQLKDSVQTSCTKRVQKTAEHFEEFWRQYPIKKNKKRARDIWKNKQLDKIAFILIEDVMRRNESDNDWARGYIPHATTYLNGERWEDEITTKQRTQRSDSVSAAKDELEDWMGNIAKSA